MADDKAKAEALIKKQAADAKKAEEEAAAEAARAKAHKDQAE